jgi:transposase
MVRKDVRTLSAAVQQNLRVNVVLYLRKHKGTQAEAAETFGLSLSAVKKVWGIYKMKGMKGLRIAKLGRPKGGAALTNAEVRKICTKIRAATPDEYDIPYFLWTTDAVRLLIKQVAGIDYSSRHVGRLLKEWGFSYQKPLYKAYEQDSRKVAAWLEDQYRRIAAKAKRQKAIIYWEDETGMRSDHQAGKSWSPKGRTPVIARTGQRFSLNMIAAVSNQGYLQFMIVDGKFNSEVFIAFLRQLIKGHDQKIMLIVDGHPSHKTKKVELWLNDHQQAIELFYLPPYSPELNPAEYFNQDIKTNAVGKARPKTKEELKAIVKAFATKKRKHRQKIKNYFHAQQVNYAA